MKPAALSEQELLERFQQRRASPHVPDALSPLSDPVRMALALLPTSTVDALQAVDPQCPSIAVSLQALHEQGLLDADIGALPGNESTRPPSPGFVPAVRPAAKLRQRLLDVFAGAQRDAAAGAHALREVSQQVGATLISAAIELPETTSRWARLAAAGPGAASRLDAEAERAAERLDSADLSRWLDAAAPLAALFERDKDLGLRLAVERAGRQLELLRREQADRRHLQTFFARPEQLDPLDAFLDDRSGRDRWMLHLLGSGGVGKTMLIRHLTLEMAKARGFLSARVDFDFLSPDYPRLDPGLLLWSLGRELQLRTTSEDAVRALREAEGQFRHLSDVLRNERERGGRDPGVRATRHPFFVEATVLFVSALKHAGAPILVVLDTCEELVKGRARGGVSDAVSETFRILYALRYGARTLLDDTFTPGDVEADVRVVFAGRRPLARAGDGWTAISDLEPRPALQVYELRGFSTAEAEEWLGRRLQAPLDLVPAVIAATPDIDAGASVTWDDGRPPREIGKNPYDLKHFADWAKETPPPSREVLASGWARQYVEERILSKLDPRPELERFLAALCVVKHADRELLQAVVDVEQFDERLAVLTAHEWIVRRVVIGKGDEPREIYQLEERLRRRLRGYFEERGANLAKIGARAADVLGPRTLDRDLAFVDVTDVDATLQTFEWDPAAGRVWWGAFVDRAITQRDFDGLLRFTDFLLGDEQAAGPRKLQDGPEHPLRAQVMGDQAAALARTGALDESGSAWLAVAELLAGRKATGDEIIVDPTTGPVREEVLAVRALMGQIAATAGRLDVDALSKALVMWTDAMTRPQEAQDAFFSISVAGLGALEALAERLERLRLDGDKERAALKKAAVHWGPGMVGNDPSRSDRAIPALVRAMWWISVARTGLYLKSNWRGLECFTRAREAMRAHADAASIPRFLDWTPPANPLARVLVEGLRHGAALDADAIRLEQVDRSVELSLYDTPELDEDRDRLWAWLLLDQANKAFPDPESPAGKSFANQLAFALKVPLSGTTVAGRPGVNAHRLIPPLAVVGARLACERGETSKGLAPLLTAGSDWALDHTIRLHVSRALVHIGALLRRPVSDRGVDDLRNAEHDWALARTLFACDPLASGQPSLPLRRDVEGADLLLGFVRPADEGSAADLLPPRERWRLTPGRISAACGPLADWRRAARIEEVATELLGARENARSLFDAGDIAGFIERDAGIRLLEQAVVQFERAGDRVGQFAALARLSVLAASGEAATAEGLQSALDRCQPAHDAVADPGRAHGNIPWSHIEAGSTLIASPGFLSFWRFRLGLCFVRLRQLRGEPPKRESFFKGPNEVYLQQGRFADVLQMLGRDPWNGVMRDEAPQSQYDRLASWFWPVVANSPPLNRLVAALLRIEASFLECWIQLSTWVNPRTTVGFRSGELLLLRVQGMAEALEKFRVAQSEVPEPQPAPATSPSAGPAPSPEPPPASPEATPDPAEPPPAAAPKGSDRGMYVALIAGWTILGTFLIAGFYGVRPLIRWLLQRGSGTPAPVVASWSRLLVEVGVYAVLAVAFFFTMGFVWVWILRQRRRRSRLVLSLLSSPETSTLAGEVEVEGAIEHSRFPFAGGRLDAFEKWKPWTIDLLASSLRTEQSELAQFLSFITPSQRIQITAGGPMALRAPWETMIARRLGGHVSALRVSHRAVVLLPMGVSGRGVNQARGVVLLTEHEASGRFAEDNWRAVGETVSRLTGAGRATEAAEPASGASPLRVAHVIGEVESRYGDVRVRFASNGGALSADEFVETVGIPSLVVLQGPLRPELTRREDSDRLEAAARRDLAYRLHGAAVPLILVLPRLDPHLIEIALRNVASTARGGRGVDPWLDTVARIRGEISVHCANREDGDELAGDVCLFAGDWHERVLS